SPHKERDIKKAPSVEPGALRMEQAGRNLPAYLDARSAAWTAAPRAARTNAVGDHFDPKRVVTLEVRGAGRLTQRVETVHRLPRSCRSEAWQLEDDPGAFVHFRQRENQVRPFGLDRNLGTDAHVRARDLVVATVAAQNDRRLTRTAA